MVRRKKLGKNIKKSLKKLGIPALLKSSVTLYVVLLIAIGLVLMYLSEKDYNSLMVLIATGLLTNYFNKNMTITLGVAIIASLIVRMKITQKEGFKEASKKEIKKGLNGGGDKKKAVTKQVKDMLNDKKNEKCFEWDKDKGESGDWVPNGVEKAGCKQKDDGPEMCFSADSGDCNKKDGFSKRLIPSSEPAKVGDDEEDEVDTERIDYAKTLEQAYDNLQGMLGTDGIKGLTSETSKLVEQQAGLMESLKGMGPMLKEAKSMMSGMKDMGGMETMKDMKAIINSVGGKKL